jgi:hypothetical protein
MAGNNYRDVSDIDAQSVTDDDNMYAHSDLNDWTDSRDPGDENRPAPSIPYRHIPTAAEIATGLCNNADYMLILADEIQAAAKMLVQSTAQPHHDDTRPPMTKLVDSVTDLNRTLASVCAGLNLFNPLERRATGLVHLIVPDALFDSLRKDTDTWTHSHYPKMSRHTDWLYLRVAQADAVSLSLFREHNLPNTAVSE